MFEQVNMLLLNLVVLQALCGTYCLHTGQSTVTNVANTIEATGEIEFKHKDRLKIYLNRLIIKGKENIETVGNQIKNDLHSNKNITCMLKTASKDYESMLRSYYNFFNIFQRAFIFIDRHYAYIDLIDGTHYLLSAEAMWLLKKITMNANLNNKKKNVLDVHNDISKALVKEKSIEMKFICKNYGICRPYPAFSDHSANLIAVILKLSDTKLSALVEVATKVSLRYYTFLKKITKKEDAELIVAVLQNVSVGPRSVREILKILGSILSKQFKIILNGDDDVIMRQKLMKILMDIIDKALSSDANFLDVNFQKTKLEMQRWAVGLRPRIDDICQDFASTWVKMLNFKLSKSTIKEMKSLIRALLRGFEEGDDHLAYLFEYGSDYARNDLPGQEIRFVEKIFRNK